MTQPAKHTPGPWAVKGEDTVVGPQGNTIAECCGYSIRAADKDQIRQGGREANATLIAAAPAMYEALKQTFNVMENILTDSQLDTRTSCGLTIREWTTTVRAALAQAEGKQ